MSVTIDEQFVEYVVRSLVEHPEEVKIARRVDEKGVLLELTVHQDDLGRVIGKRGATAQSLRTLLRALGTKQEARYNLKIVDVDKLDAEGNPIERPERTDQPRSASRDDQRQDSDADSDDSQDSAVLDDGSSDVQRAEEPKKESDSIARTRAELADLDDLDI